MVTWEEPVYSDNVGVYYKKCNKANKDRTYPLGVHNITYTVVDYEYNFAVCDFQINVTKRGKYVWGCGCEVRGWGQIVILDQKYQDPILFFFRGKIISLFR